MANLWTVVQYIVASEKCIISQGSFLVCAISKIVKHSVNTFSFESVNL